MGSSRRSGRIRTVLVASSAVGAMVMVMAQPAPALAAGHHAGKHAKTGTSRSTKQGSHSETATALATARRTHHRVEVVGERGLASTTYANPNGTMTQVITQAPTRARSTDGSLAPIDTRLVSSHGRLKPARTNSAVSLRAAASRSLANPTPSAAKTKLTQAAVSAVSATADGGSTSDVATLDLPGPDSVTMGFGASLPAPTVAGDTATYALSSTSSLTATTSNDGFTEDVVLDAAPTTAPVYRFPLTLAGGLTPKLANGVLQLVNTDGSVAAVSRPLQMWDAQRDAGGDPSHTAPVDATLVHATAGWELDLAPALTFLADPSTRYPVVIDPTVTTRENSDTYYSNGGTIDHGADYSVLVGSDNGTTINRTYMRWNTGPFTGRTVTGATMGIYEYEAGSCSAKVTNIYPTTSYSSVNSANVTSTTDSAWAQGPSFNVGGAGCTNSPNGYVNVDVTKIVSGWVSGEVNQYGLELRSASETDPTYAKRFCSRNAAPTGTGHCEGTTGVPSLSVTYKADYGQQGGYSLVGHRLNDRSQLSVNTQNGNTVLRASDVHLGGRGLDLSVDRFYNSLDTSDSQFGAGWRMSVGPDVYLNRGTTNDRWDYVAPGGTWYGRFVRHTDTGHTNDFYAPTFGGSDAELHDNGDGTFTMTFHSSQEKYVFSDLGCSGGTCNKVLTKDIDRNNNEIDYHYDATTRQLTSISDTHGRSIDVHHTTAGYVDSIAERSAYTSSPRTWAYHYNSANQLDYYTDPTGARTDYGYSGGLLSIITDPPQNAGIRPTTTITYSSGQATAVDYTSDGNGGYKRFTYAYSTDVSAAQAACNTDDSWSYFTTVTDASDAQGGATKYCFKDRANPPSPTTPSISSTDDRKLRVVDGNGHHRTRSFTPDNASTTGTGQSNDGATDGSTVYAYNTNNTLSKVTQPKDNSSDTAGTTSFDYATSSSVAGASFLPSSTGTSGSSCSSMSYDAKGNLTDTYAGLAANSGGTCSGATGGRHSHVDYNTADGTPADAYGPVTAGLSARTPADETVYSYLSTEPNAGELSKVVRPGGNASCSTDRTGCTTYTYDGLSRVTSTTNGNGKTTSYSYDGDDRVTAVMSDGATTCTPSAGTCVKYTFDAEGNLTQRDDRNGTTTFTYDRLNHPNTQAQPDGTRLTSSYDAAGNLTSYAQAIPGFNTDTVSYVYDAANSLTSVTDAAGTFGYSSNSDARPTKMTLPTGGVAITYGYTAHSGKISSIATTGGTGLPSFSYDYNDGSIETGKVHKLTTGGVDTTYHYDSDDRLKDATPTTGTTYAYTYDGDGNVRTAKAGSVTTYYGYTENDQLCWSGTTDGTAMGQSCPTTPSGDTAHTSDKNGNDLGTAAGPIHYNAQGQVDQISSPTGAGPVAQTYLDQGNQLRITAGGDTFATGGPLGVTSRRNNGAVTYYTRDPNGQVLDTRGAGGTFYYMLDRQGSTMALIDTTGAKAGSYTYDPYGKSTVTAGTSTSAAQTNPWRYTGGYQDPTDGYYHLGARYYDTADHFTQADPVAGNITRPEKYNGYIYAASDPTNNVDLSGEASSGEIISDCLIYGGVGAFVGGFVGGAVGAIVGGAGGCIAATLDNVIAQ